MLKKLMRNEEGVTAIEYGLIAALIAVGIIGTLGVLGGSVSGTFQTVSDGMGAAAPAP